MSDIQRGITFTTGIPDAASAHQLVDAATILPGFISGKSLATPASADSFAFLKGSALRRCTLAGLISAFPQGGAANIFALRKLGTSADSAAAGNDVRFPAQLTGVRKGNGTGADTAALPADLAFHSSNLAGKTAIDWSLADVFYESMTADKTYTFSNNSDGRVITLLLKKNGHTPTLPSFVGSLVLGSGTAFLQVVLTQSALGITAIQFQI